MAGPRSLIPEFESQWGIIKSALPRDLGAMWRPPAKLHGEPFTPSRRGHHALLTCALVGGMDFVLARLDELGVSVRRQRRWAERHRQQFVRIAETRGRELAGLVSTALLENVEAFERCLGRSET